MRFRLIQLIDGRIYVIGGFHPKFKYVRKQLFYSFLLFTNYALLRAIYYKITT